MDVDVAFDARSRMATLDVSGIPAAGDALGPLIREVVALDPRTVRLILIDFTSLDADVPFLNLTALTDELKPMLRILRTTRTAAVVDEERPVTALALSMLFNLGARIAIFSSRTEAMTWLRT